MPGAWAAQTRHDLRPGAGTDARDCAADRDAIPGRSGQKERPAHPASRRDGAVCTTGAASADGAGRFRLLRQLLTESLILSALGGALGLLLAKWGVTALLSVFADSLPRAGEIGLDGRVVGFTLLISLLTGIVFGLPPALQSAGAELQTALKESGAAGAGPQRYWLRCALVVLEVAASLVLLAGAGLLIRSFAPLQQADVGLRPEHVLTMGVALPPAKYATPQATVTFYEQLLERVAALPGVESAGVIR